MTDPVPAGASTPALFLVDALPSGHSAELIGEEARHAVTVRRMRAGESLALSDGAGGLAHCVIETVRPGKNPVLELRVDRRETVAAPVPRLVVVQALVKGDRGELAVELATEAGADEIVPWRAARCVARWEAGPRGDKALARWRATVRSAAKQARRAWLPEVREPVDTTGLAELVAADAAAAVVLDAGASEALDAWAVPDAGVLYLVVGPEGGITSAELETLGAAGARSAHLGPTVLRASSAAAVSLGALGVLSGRWRPAGQSG
ncbi:16S rRNA (uracil1498-N3)-methyltransferase [Tamaricihabitans halophyticus]|uniref:Ribosomal RNA small subunit methyltransferase E n=1 Tax=Tamaricihabitans halophyticus TaxID=1262583 RepID=A0A4V2SUJ7_9PSEU|nr:16S rRNA (uracil(1498)-N(3))-methyltransferase [Tamaricihabitans halophyticus]TCP54896.1 16S rRNA (uracil1498-N3)-methyltransferase [Tamaricihabitans halophyticus]